MLGVTGTSALGAGKNADTNKMKQTTKDHVEMLTGPLVKQMKKKFASQIADDSAASVVEAEVQDFMRLNTYVQEHDLSMLERRIESRLIGLQRKDSRGNTVQPISRTMQKKQMVDEDEWARITRYQLAEAEEEERRKRNQRASDIKATREALAQQVLEKEARERREREQDEVFHEAEMKDIRQWEQQQAEARRQRMEHARRIREDQDAQVREMQELRATIRATQQLEDELLVSQITLEQKKAMKEEAEQRKAQAAMLERIKEENETTKRMREEAKRREAEEELNYAREQDEMMARQQKAREAQLEKIAEWQKARDLTGRPRQPSRRWLDEGTIEEQEREKAQRDAQEDERRKAAARNRNEATRKALDEQVQAKKQREEEERRKEHQYAAAIMGDVEAAQQEKKLRKEQGRAQKDHLRNDLEKQMRQRARASKVVLMTEEERRLNKDLLSRVQEFTLKSSQQGAGTNPITHR